SVAEPEPFDSTAAPGDQGLHLLQPGAEFVLLRVKEGEQAAVTFRDMGREIKNRAHSAQRQRAEEREVCPGNEHDYERGRADQDRGPEIDLGDDQPEQQTNDGDGNEKAAPKFPALNFIMRKPEGQEKDRRDLGKLRGLTGNPVKFEPAPRTIN